MNNCNCQTLNPDCEMNRWESCPSSIIADAENYYTKIQVDELLEEIESGITSGCCITPDEVDEKISAATSGLQETLIAGDNITISGNVISASGCDLTNYYTKDEVNSAITSAITVVEGEIPSLSGYATEQWVEDKHYITGVDLSDYATEQWVLDKHYISGVDLSDYVTNENLSSYTYSKTEIDNKIGSGGTFDPTMYYTTANTYNKTEVNNLLDNKLDASAYTPTDLSQYWTSAQTNSAITQAVSGKANSSDVITNLTIDYDDIAASDNAFYYQYTKGGHDESSEIFIPRSGLTVNVTTVGDTKHNYLDVNTTSAITSGSTAIPTSDAVYNYTQNNFMLKSQIWCGTESQWSQISGSTDPNTLYLIHD